MCGVDDCRIVSLEVFEIRLHRHYMRESRAVTVFATDGQLREWRAFETTISLEDLKRNKRASGRKKDLLDLDELP